MYTVLEEALIVMCLIYYGVSCLSYAICPFYEGMAFHSFLIAPKWSATSESLLTGSQNRSLDCLLMKSNTDIMSTILFRNIIISYSVFPCYVEQLVQASNLCNYHFFSFLYFQWLRQELIEQGGAEKLGWVINAVLVSSSTSVL